jgi:CubicO group peptidase (beta-lactamase class C family)
MKKQSVAAGLSFGLILLLFAVLVACGGGSGGSAPLTSLPQFYPGSTPVPTSGQDVPGVQAYDQQVSAVLKKWNIPGAAIAVSKNGKLILARGYGYADFEAKQLMQPDSMMRIGSNTKVLTSMAILHLKDQGLLNIDTKFLDILTDYQVQSGGDSRLRNITIRNLLQHSGGWDRDKTGDPMGWQGTISRALGIPMPVLCPDVIRYMMGQPLDFAPGTKQVYSNFGYCILGRVIEKVSGEPYEIYVRNHVLTPMDIHAMSIGTSHRLSERGPYEVKYYEYDGAPLVDSVFPGEGKVPADYGGFEILTIDSCGGWIGSPIDLTRVMTAIDGSRVAAFLSSETMAEFLADPGLPDWNTNSNYWYGLGIFVGPTPQTWYHGGTINGTKSQLLRDGNGYTWSIMTNSIAQDPGRLGNDMDSAMLTALGPGLEGSASDLYPQYPSPDLPPRTH